MCRSLGPGDAVPSVSELARLQGLKHGTISRAYLALATEGLLTVRLAGAQDKLAQIDRRPTTDLGMPVFLQATSPAAEPRRPVNA